MAGYTDEIIRKKTTMFAFRSGKGHVQSGETEHHRHDTGHGYDETFRTLGQIRERLQQTVDPRRWAGRRIGELYCESKTSS